jgi:hypothetical protein
MMKLEAAERDVPADPAVLRLPPAALLVVAGVPWAGKTTLLSRVEAPGSLVLDPEPLWDRFARVLAPVPYRLWRPLVHAEHFLRVLPALPARRGLIAHDTGTPAGAASQRRWPPRRPGTWRPRWGSLRLSRRGLASVRLLDRPAGPGGDPPALGAAGRRRDRGHIRRVRGSRPPSRCLDSVSR